MTQQIYVHANEYYGNIDHLKEMIWYTINKHLEFPETNYGLFKDVFGGFELSVSPSKKAPRVLRLDDSDIINPEDIVVGIDSCWVRIEDYVADMWTLYTNAYTEIMTSEVIPDYIKNTITTELDDVAYFNEFIDGLSLIDIRRYVENG